METFIIEWQLQADSKWLNHDCMDSVMTIFHTIENLEYYPHKNTHGKFTSRVQNSLRQKNNLVHRPLSEKLKDHQTPECTDLFRIHFVKFFWLK